MSVLVYSDNGKFVSKSSLSDALTDADTLGKRIVITTPQTIDSVLNVTGRQFECVGAGRILYADSGVITFDKGTVAGVPAWWFGLDGINDEVAINKAAVAAGTNNTLMLDQDYACAGTVQIIGNCDGTNGVLNFATDYDDLGLLYGYMSASYLYAITAVLPKVVKAATSIYESNAVGIRISNVYTGEITLQEINNWTVGLRIGGHTSNGVSYCNINMPSMYDNKISVYLGGESGGWCNENNYFGGRLAQSLSKGERDPVTDNGWRHVKIAQGTGTIPNNNRFYGLSCEGGTSFYWWELSGCQNNYFMKVRCESQDGYTLNSQIFYDPPTTKFTQYNDIEFAYHGAGGFIKPTIVYGTSGGTARSNSVNVFQNREIIGTTTDANGVLAIQNNASDKTNAFTIYPTTEGVIDATPENWVTAFSPDWGVTFKGSTDTGLGARLWADGLQFGTGSSVGATSADPVTDVITATAHGLTGGVTLFCLASTIGAISAGRTYYVGNVASVDTFKLYQNLEDLRTGLNIDITSDGIATFAVVYVNIVPNPQLKSLKINGGLSFPDMYTNLPAASASNATIYSQKDGITGKMKLVVQFPTGSAIVIATEA